MKWIRQETKYQQENVTAQKLGYHPRLLINLRSKLLSVRHYYEKELLKPSI